MLNAIKQRCGIAPAITAFDEEITGHIDAAVEDMRASGVPARLAFCGSSNARVINCVALYVLGARANEPNTISRYDALYKKAVFRLTLEDEDVQ